MLTKFLTFIEKNFNIKKLISIIYIQFLKNLETSENGTHVPTPNICLS